MNTLTKMDQAAASSFSWLDVIKEPIKAKGRRVDGTPFSVEECFESDPSTTGRKCLELFKSKGGLFHSVNPFSHESEEKIPFKILLGDEVRPGCSGGWCRSQALYKKLSEFAPKQIKLLSPHATRYGCDPYNGQVNWNEEVSPDAFEDWAGTEKVLRFGFENLSKWKQLESNPTVENLKVVKEYYDRHYFADKLDQNRRVYITFAANAHVVLKRLIETNQKLDHVVVVHIDLDDSMTVPYNEKLISALSVEAFEAFSRLLDSVLDLTELKK